VNEIERRLNQVRVRIGEAAARARRSPADVRLIAVSKTFPIDAVRAAYAAGQRDFGENRLQEALQKLDRAADMEIRWHLVGHLQSNKARKAAERMALIHSIDSVDLLRQVDLALEPTKHGVPLDMLRGIFEHAPCLTAARVVGLMLLPPLAENPEDARPWFRRLRDERDRLALEGVPGHLLRELSMGMSGDFEVAIEEGATMVRVGTAIFGAR